ncbi:MAG TPA: UDP-N-acetylglucosamine--N-acetylmuramyl-(pentapeptide) pyrophosphoryl-undecaprenol N-acetylglucosamine transferase [Phycisphaerales bacterium]|nr:UDP-N-acetylglucosamine--N-acetylmuramyl-(pentapeptide) pyrophosphoryl-undecaprenol N-acetylglucosamine transferase [Phycisphaerales bacterium]
MDAPQIIFAGGGTGGHIFPALAIAEEVVKAVPSAGISFVVSQRPLDADILRKLRLAGQPARFSPVSARPFGVSPKVLYRFVSDWGMSVRECRAILRDAKQQGPCVLVAMGGFVAAPAAQAARVEKVPVLLVNLDAVPGRANRWIAKRAARVVTSAPIAHGGFPSWETIPPIVRAGAISHQSPAQCRRALGLAPHRPTLLVTGGSQGATSINDFLAAFSQSPQHASALTGWQVIHQTGPGRGEESVRAAYAQANVPALVAPFLDRMGDCWGAADLSVCRSGAGNVGEVWASRVPSIFLPYPYHKDQHQKFNAQVLVKSAGAVLCEDRITRDANIAGVAPVLSELLRNTSKRDAMKAALTGLGPADGAGTAARAIITMAVP